MTRGSEWDTLILTPMRFRIVNIALGATRVTPSEILAADADSTGGREVIVIVRDRTNPTGPTQVMTLNQPSADLMEMIQQQAK